MAKFILVGALGTMGQVVEKLAADDIVCGIDQKKNRLTGPYPVYKDLNEIPKEVFTEAQCILDFSHPSAFSNTLDLAQEHKLPLVVATTGLSQENISRAAIIAEDIPIVISANMSQGINALMSILGDLVHLLGPEYDIEILEKHHRKKVDAPSGTALMLAHTINRNLDQPYKINVNRSGVDSQRKDKEIGISSMRGGTIPGEHVVMFAGDDEIIEIKHTALSKNIFANGALRACNWIIKQPPGLYDMQDVLHNYPNGPFVYKKTN